MIEELVHIKADSVMLEGALTLPEETESVVIFAHGSGSSRHSKRNQFVADVLRKAGIGTLLFDLLTEAEDTVYENRFDIPLITRRLIASTLWLKEKQQAKRFRTGELNTGYFGASTGAAAAIGAAAELVDDIGAVVSRGGRPDLAMEALDRLRAPTLLIVGGRDESVLELNQQAYGLINAEKELAVVPGATHLFEEPGALEEVARLAAEWFGRHLAGKKSAPKSPQSLTL
jgi:predicted alpha/beta-hydrolase family hydrolase